MNLPDEEQALRSHYYWRVKYVERAVLPYSNQIL